MAQDYGSTRAPRGPHRVGDKKKRGRIPSGTGKAATAPSKEKESGGDTNQEEQGPQPVSTSGKQSFGTTRAPRGPHKVGFKQAKNKYVMGK